LLGIIALLPALIYVPVPDAYAQVSTAPTVTLAATNVAGNAITLTMSEFVTDNNATPTEFTISGAASNPVVSSISVSGGPVILTLSTAVAKGETITVSYTKSSGSIEDVDGNPLASFTGTAVTNRASGVVPATPVSAVTDESGGFTVLRGAVDAETFVIGTSTYAIIVSEDDDGIQIIDVTTPTSPVAVAAVTDNSGGFTALDRARGITTFTTASNTYAIVASQDDDGIQIIDVTTPASPTSVAAITDDTSSGNTGDSP